MERLYSIEEALNYLNDGVVITDNGLRLFVYKRKRVCVYFEGSSYSLSIDEFKELFKNTVFYIYEDNANEIDSDKDEAYYRYYRK